MPNWVKSIIAPKSAFIRLLGLALTIVNCQLLIAQTHKLPEITVSEEKLQFIDISPNKTFIDTGIISLVLLNKSALNFAEILNRSTGVAIKNYGGSNISTIAVRGSSSSQTTTVWGGFNINQTWQGLADISLLSGLAFNRFALLPSPGEQIQAGMQPGGTLLLANEPRFQNKNKLSLSAALGSFGLQRYVFQANFARKNWEGITTATLHKANNNYPYINFYKNGKPEERLTNSSLDLKSVISEWFYKVSARQRLELGGWFTETKRQLPPTMLMLQSVAHQTDRSLRVRAAWKYRSERFYSEVSAAWFKEFLNYNDSISAINEDSRSTTTQTFAKAGYQVSKHFSVNGGTQVQYLQAATKNYTGDLGVWNYAAFANAGYSFPKWHLELLARKDFRAKTNIPAGYGLKAGFHNKGFKLWGNAMRVYRQASFNDQYWTPGGNPNLKSEDGVSTELGLGYNPNKDSSTVGLPALQIATYSKWINNWIQWLPSGVIWVPINAKSVWSRGVEVKLSEQIKLRKYLIGLGIGYHFNQSTNRSSYQINDESIGKQLIYVPAHKLNTAFTFGWKGFNFTTDIVWNGSVYIRADNSESLKGAFTLNSMLSKKFKFFSPSSLQYSDKKLKFSIEMYLSANNCTNNSYQSVAQRPMPGVNFISGITLMME